MVDSPAKVKQKQSAVKNYNQRNEAFPTKQLKAVIIYY